MILINIHTTEKNKAETAKFTADLNKLFQFSINYIRSAKIIRSVKTRTNIGSQAYVQLNNILMEFYKHHDRFYQKLIFHYSRK